MWAALTVPIPTMDKQLRELAALFESEPIHQALADALAGDKRHPRVVPRGHSEVVDPHILFIGPVQGPGARVLRLKFRRGDNFKDGGDECSVDVDVVLLQHISNHPAVPEGAIDHRLHMLLDQLNRFVGEDVRSSHDHPIMYVVPLESGSHEEVWGQIQFLVMFRRWAESCVDR